MIGSPETCFQATLSKQNARSPSAFRSGYKGPSTVSCFDLPAPHPARSTSPFAYPTESRLTLL